MPSKSPAWPRRHPSQPQPNTNKVTAEITNDKPVPCQTGIILELSRADEKNRAGPPSSRLIIWHGSAFGRARPAPAFSAAPIFPSRAPSPSPFAPLPCPDCAWDSDSAHAPVPRFPKAALRERREFSCASWICISARLTASSDVRPHGPFRRAESRRDR